MFLVCSAVKSNNATLFRLTFCEVLYVTGLKLIGLKVAKLLTDVHGNHLDDISDVTESVDELEIRIVLLTMLVSCMERYIRAPLASALYLLPT